MRIRKSSFSSSLKWTHLRWFVSTENGKLYQPFLDWKKNCFLNWRQYENQQYEGTVFCKNRTCEWGFTFVLCFLSYRSSLFPIFCFCFAGWHLSETYMIHLFFLLVFVSFSVCHMLLSEGFSNSLKGELAEGKRKCTALLWTASHLDKACLSLPYWLPS